jgi:pyruvate dehydrogenase E1 component
MFRSEESPSPVQNDGADPDPLETREWLESLDAVVRRAGKERGQFLMKELEARAQQLGVATPVTPYSSYRNTISLDEQLVHPGDVVLEDRITAIVRWNALAMVVRANKAYGELGGHIASYASAAEFSRWASTTSFAVRSQSRGAILCTFSRTPHRGCMPGRFSRAG